MTRVEEILIETVRRCINKEEVVRHTLDKEETEELLERSSKQQLLAMVYDYLVRAKMVSVLEREENKEWQKKAITQVFRQITQKNEFLNIIEECQERGHDPVVVKGMICRELYPIPEVRYSVDEDIFILRSESEFYHELFLSEGMTLDNEKSDIENDYELSYHKTNSPTYIEVHKRLFDPEARGYGDLNRFFGEEVFDRTEKVPIDDIYVRTLPHTEHLLFLIFHAYKHFIYSGVGIRPICDIGMFSRKYHEEIDWEQIRKCLEESNTFYYARGLYKIIEEYFITDIEDYIPDWNLDEIEVEDLLRDSLDGGALGNESVERLNTANMTLEAVEGRSRGYLLKTIFPSVRKLRGRYGYLNKMPYLLPVAWVDRIVHYLHDSVINRRGRPGESIRLGKERINLLKKFRIIQ